MFTKLGEKVYQCDECKKVLTTEKGITKHINSTHVVQKAKNTMQKTIEDIRVTSKSIHEVVKRLKAMWLENGIEVNFSAYPDNFNYVVSNSHNSPTGYKQNWGGKDELPRGYPGWSGQWSGHVKVIDQERWGETMYFSDLRDSYHRTKGSLPPIPWLKTGSGGGGDSFRFSGMLFMYDFPEMHKEFKDAGEEFTVLKEEYSDSVAAYKTRYNKERELYIKQAALAQKIKDIKDVAASVNSDIQKALKKVSDHLHGEFTADYTDEIPLPESIFVDDSLVASAHHLKTATKTPPPNLKGFHARIENIAKSLGDYIKNNPEVMI